MIRRPLSSAGLLRLLLTLCAVTLSVLWAVHLNQKAASRRAALAGKAAEHLNLRQLVDRAQAVGRVTQDDM